MAQYLETSRNRNRASVELLGAALRAVPTHRIYPIASYSVITASGGMRALHLAYYEVDGLQFSSVWTGVKAGNDKFGEEFLGFLSRLWYASQTGRTG
jgi:hypothetical protein